MYYITTKLNDKSITWRHPLEDPFVRNETSISWWDRLKSLFKKELRVTVIIDADREVIFKVMNIDRFDPFAETGDAIAEERS